MHYISCLAKLHKFRPNIVLQCQRHKTETGTLLQMLWECSRLMELWAQAQHLGVTAKLPHS